MSKTYIGKNEDGLHCFIEWNLKDGKFSATGHYLNKAGNDWDSGGQILDTILEDFPDNEQVQRMHAVWERWHLNDMRAGSPRQQAAIESEINPAFEKYKQQIESHNRRCYDYKSELMEKIKDKLWNQHHNPERVLKNFLDSIVIKDNKILSYIRFLIEDEKVVSGGYGQGARSVSISKTRAEILKAGAYDSPDWYSYVCQRLELLGLLVDSEYLVEKVVVIDGAHHKLNVAYKYGSKWLKEELPAEVVDEINSWIEVPFEEKTPIQLLAEKWGGKLVFKCWDKEVKTRGHYKLSLSNGATFPYFCGSESDINPENAIACVLRDAYSAKDGTELATEYFIEELDYEYKEAKKVAKACYETYQKLEGLWDEDVEELASQL